MKAVQISGLSAPELAPYTRLTEAQLRAKRQPESGVFIAESENVIAQALKAGCEPVSALAPAHFLPRAEKLFKNFPALPVYTASDKVLEELTGYRLHRGFLCALRRPAERAAETVMAGARRLAVLEGIVDPTNLGALFRSAAALGMDGILLSPHCCEPFHRRALRVSMGTVFQIPWAYLGRERALWPLEALGQLKTAGFQTAALALDRRAVSIEAPELRGAEKLALFLGTEGTGLLPETIRFCDQTVVIPMAHGVDSLNVAAAGAVAFWELRAR